MTQIALCNRALSAAGEAETITSIAPPSGSANAQSCATHYQSSLEMVTTSRAWSFCNKRVLLAKPRIAISSVDTGSDNLTTATAHGCETNDLLTFARAVAGAGTAPGGLTFDEQYYAINGGSTTLRLTDEEDGNAIDITSAGGGSWVLERETDRPGEYMFALPSDCLVERWVVDPDAPDEWPTHHYWPHDVAWAHRGYHYSTDCGHGSRQPYQPKRARNKAGEVVIYSPLEECHLLYTAALTEVTDMPPEFQEAVVMQLASKLVMHRDPKRSRELRAEAQYWISEAARIDAQRSPAPARRSYPWTRG